MKTCRNEENKKLEVHIGYASRAAGDCSRREEAAEEVLPQECGDTAVSCRLPDGSRAVILSDGMGHGFEAAADSRTAAGLLRRLLKTGMPAARAMKEVNRYLLERNLRLDQKESYATVDLMIVDQNSGRAKFYKMGAAPTYLIRGRRIRRLEQPALPVGILPVIRLTHVSTRLVPGDIIVMMSDGIRDSGFCREGSSAGCEKKEGQREEDWLISFFYDMLCGNGCMGTAGRNRPRKLAAAVLEEAGRRYGTAEADDATAAVIVIGESSRKKKDEE